MVNSVETLERLRDDLVSNPDLIDQVLIEKFDLSAVLSGAKTLGYDASEADIEAYLEKINPTGHGMADMKYYVSDGEEGEFRELTAAETELVGGGLTLVAAVVSVVVAAYAVVLAVGAAIVFIAVVGV